MLPTSVLTGQIKNKTYACKPSAPSNAKDAPSDAQLHLELLMQHRDKLKPLQSQGMEMRTLQCLVEQRRGLVNDRVRVTNQLTYALKQYFPQPLEWFKEKDTRIFCDFLDRWPTLRQAGLG